MESKEEKQILEYEGGCLCKETTFIVRGEPINPHLCSCGMCRKSSGALTVAWVSFPLEGFKWIGNLPNFYRSSEKTQRCSCGKCGGLLAALNDGDPTICITLGSLENSSLENSKLIIPGKQHSFEESAPKWWKPEVLNSEKLSSSVFRPA
jgi:hypothetical protein